MALTPGARVGVYQVTSIIGEGGMGRVYRALDTGLNRDVALKVLPDSFAHDADRLARFTREAQTLASLNHPGIAHIYGLERQEGREGQESREGQDGTIAIVMELVEGEDLAHRIVRGAIPLDEALPIAKQIAEALEAAHERGIIHRDLKPANIKVRPDGAVKVLDFGLAKAIESSRTAGSGPHSGPLLSQSPTITSPAMTAAGMILGTAAYMAPEQAKGRAVDQRADIWAFGCVVFEMLTGARAFAGEDVSEVLASVLAREPDWSRLPANLPPALTTYLRRCLHRDPRQRVQAIGDVRLALDGAFDAAVAQTTAPPAAVKGARLAWAAFAMAAIAATALAIPATRYLRHTTSPRDVVSFTIPPPPDAMFRELAISPDGSRVVLTVADHTGSRRMWIRQLNSLKLQPLAGTEGAARPFWSPDSRSIAFTVGPRLFKYDVERGSVQPVLNTGETTGGTWLDDGSIVFAQNLGGLYRLRPGSSEAQALTTLDVSRKETRHYWPAVLPGNRHFLFLVTSALPEVQGIWVASLDNPADRHRVLADVAMAAYSDGRLFFVRGETLMAQPFDMQQLTVGGEAVPVFDHIGHFANTGYGAFSVAANGTVVTLGRSGPGRLQWYDRTGKSLGPIGAPGRYQWVVFSPDGKRIALDADSDTSPGYKIFVIDAERGTTAQLTVGDATGNFPAWSPDGRQLAFASLRDGVFNLYVKPSTGAGQETLVLKSDVNKFLMDWSPDGQFLLFSQRGAGPTSIDLLTLPISGEKTPRLYLRGISDQRNARFSPDGKWVAYQSNESSRWEVYVQSFPAGADKVQISTSGGMHPVWDRDGKELYYLTQAGTLMAVPVKTGAAFAAGVPVRLFQTWTTNILEGFDATRDGRFVFLTPEGDLQEPATVILNWH